MFRIPAPHSDTEPLDFKRDPRKRDDEINPFQLTECAAAIRSLGKSAASFEDLASKMTEHIFTNLRTVSEQKHACALVRCFRTIDFQSLEPALKANVLARHPKVQAQDKFLTLFGTNGVESKWNSRKTSAGHQAIPLFSAELISESPMIARLLSELGIEISSLLHSPSSKMEFKNPADRDYNVFFVDDAQRSPFIPAQVEFVTPYNIRSVVGYGSLLPDGHFYAVIMFFKIKLPKTIVLQFTALALSSTIAVLSTPMEKLFTKI